MPVGGFRAPKDLTRQRLPGGRLGGVVTVVVGADVVAGVLVTVTVLVLVLVDGGGTSTVVVLVVTLVVDEVVVAEAAAITPHAMRLLDSAAGAPPRLSAL